MTNPTPDPVALEDRLEAVKAWVSTISNRFEMPAHVEDEINLHLATLDDAIEAVTFDKV